MRKLLPLLVILTLAACDSTEDDELSDSERFVGTWTVDQLLSDIGGDDETDVTEELIGADGVLNRFSATFTDDGEVTMSVDFRDAGQDDLALQGTYSVQEQTDFITIRLTLPGTTTTFPATSAYEFDGDDTVSLILPSFVVNGILQAGEIDFALDGDVGARFVR